MFMGNQDNSYTMVDLYQNNRVLGYKDSYNYYDIDVDKILLFKKSNNEYIIRYNDVPLQLNFFFGELHTFANNNRVVPIHSDDKELFRKCREIWNKITELIGIDNPTDFVETTLNDNADEFIMVDVEKNTSAIRQKYRNNLVIVLHSAINDLPQTSLVQHRFNTHKYAH